MNHDFSQKTIKDLHEEYYGEMTKIVEELRKIYLLRRSRWVSKILEALLLELTDATNNYQACMNTYVDIFSKYAKKVSSSTTDIDI